MTVCQNVLVYIWVLVPVVKYQVEHSFIIYYWNLLQSLEVTPTSGGFINHTSDFVSQTLPVGGICIIQTRAAGYSPGHLAGISHTPWCRETACGPLVTRTSHPCRVSATWAVSVGSFSPRWALGVHEYSPPHLLEFSSYK